MIEVLLFGYLVAGVVTAAYVHHRTRGSRSEARLFDLDDRMMVVVACAVVGVLWPLFMPATAVVVARGIRRSFNPRAAGWGLLGHRPARAR